ncbi:lipid II-degrading bacteriocin [Pantoea stewartii]|uniref:lipid II-degrading bacteriocin n=1 Tax=Pantoea stewartii TaxID=66269 RepID=UPI0025A2F33D|nr:lipid II-degrading bacteriocin [Pantoea stewartii]
MSEGTMVVTAPVVSGDPMVGGAYGSYSPGGAVGVPASQAMGMQAVSIQNGGGFDGTCDIMERAANENNKDVVMNNLRQSIYFDQCLVNNPVGIMDWLTTPQVRNSYQISDMGDQLSGTLWSPFSAMANFLWGNGRTMNVDINRIGLNLQPAGINGFQDKLASMSAPGIYNFTHQFAYNTGNDSVAANLYLGNITLKIEGTLNRAADGTWTLSANARGFQDTYDFNASTHRTIAAEQLTTAGRFLQSLTSGSKPFPININGDLPVTMSGH